MSTLESMRCLLFEALDSAREVYRAEKDRPSRDFAAGRYDGLMQAVEVADQLLSDNNLNPRSGYEYS
jgi:hypothetical protein